MQIEALFRQADTPCRLEDDGAALGLAELEEEGGAVVAQGHHDIVVLGQDDRRQTARVRLHCVHQPKPST